LNEKDNNILSLKDNFSLKDNIINELEDKLNSAVEHMKNYRELDTRCKYLENSLKDEQKITSQLNNKFEETEQKYKKELEKKILSSNNNNSGVEKAQYESKIKFLEQQLDRLRDALQETEDRAQKAEEKVKNMHLQSNTQTSGNTDNIPLLVVTGGPPPPPMIVTGGPPPPPMLGGPPPPPGMGPPNLGGPPPPPPNLGGPSGKLKINKTGQSTNINITSTTNDTPPPPNPQDDLIKAIQKGVTLKKTEGPVSYEKKIEKDKKEETNPFSIGALASELAKQRALRVQQKALQGSGAYRKSIRLDNLLEELK